MTSEAVTALCFVFLVTLWTAALSASLWEACRTEKQANRPGNRAAGAWLWDEETGSTRETNEKKKANAR